MTNARRKIITPKGQRYPGSGRVRGKPNRVTVELRALFGQLVNDLAYQSKLRRDFRARRVHPTIEALVWGYHAGKPPQQIDINARIDVSARLEEEKRIFASLDLADLEQLAADSQALVDRAAMLSAARLAGATPQPIDISPRRDDLPKVSGETLTIISGSDNGGYGYLPAGSAEDGATDDGTAAQRADDPPDAERTT